MLYRGVPESEREDLEADSQALTPPGRATFKTLQLDGLSFADNPCDDRRARASRARFARDCCSLLRLTGCPGAVIRGS